MAARKLRPPPPGNIWGPAEVAEHLDIYVQNLNGRNRPAGLPEPFDKIRACPLWWAAEIKAFAPGFFERRAERERQRAHLEKLRAAAGRRSSSAAAA